MVHPNQKWVLRSLQPVAPFLQGHFNGQQPPIPHIVIPFHGREFPAEEGAGVELAVRSRTLGKDHPTPTSEASGRARTGAEVKVTFNF